MVINSFQITALQIQMKTKTYCFNMFQLSIADPKNVSDERESFYGNILEERVQCSQL